jgi:preprotein translocase subunit YajC
VTELGALLPILLIIVAFYFLILRPAQKRQAEQRRVVSALAPGVRVMTTGGLFGTVVAVEGNEIALEIADGVVVRYLDGAVAKVVTDSPGTDPAARTSSEDDTPGIQAP